MALRNWVGLSTYLLLVGDYYGKTCLQHATTQDSDPAFRTQLASGFIPGTAKPFVDR